MSKIRLISKTDYILYRECPKNAWLKQHKPDEYYKFELSDFEKHIIETGNEVEGVARKLFPSGVLIEGRDEAAQELTTKLVSEKKTMFQPVFVKDGLLAAVDVLQYDEPSQSWHIYEIKASNEVDKNVHVADLAFQVYLLRLCGLNIGKAHVLKMNSEYVRQGELDITALFSPEDLTETINNSAEEYAQEIEKAKEYLNSEKEPSGPCVCIYKGRSKHCTTFSYSNPEVPKYGVHDITRIGSSKRKLMELIDGNIYHIENVPDNLELTESQRNQVDAHNTERVTIRRAEIADQLENLKYPIYFLDYETFPAAIPRFDGFSPYQQTPFQYSLHILDTPDGEPRHCDFLYTEQGDPSRSFGESLARDIGPEGSVIVWNKGFEMTINKQLAKRLPEFSGLVASINERVFDLMEVFSKQNYVHKGFKGSSSIKKVLPVLVPELSYKDLEIGEGGTATNAWNKMVSGEMSKEEAEETAKHLRIYCKLDTYAMYAIWDRVRREI